MNSLCEFVARGNVTTVLLRETGIELGQIRRHPTIGGQVFHPSSYNVSRREAVPMTWREMREISAYMESVE